MTKAITEFRQARSQRLKAATHSTHDAFDKRLIAADIFASRDRFAGFLRVQYRFHRDTHALYANPRLAAPLPDLAERDCLLKIANDLTDLRHVLPAPQPVCLGAGTPLPTALGWLYVAEGSSLGGTVLFKIASEKLGLGRSFGARHLAAHPDGAARHWRQFTAVLDAVELSPQEEGIVVQGAKDAFCTVRGYVEEELPLADN